MTNHSSNPFWTTDVKRLRGPWLGEDFPGTAPKELCPELLATGRYSFCTVFSSDGDEFYFATADLKQEIGHLVWMKMKPDGSWTRPEPAPFNSQWNDNDLCMSPNGQRVAWRSWRPLPGKKEPEKSSALWASDRTADGWGAPFPIQCGDEIAYGGYPGIAQSGNLYFAGRRSPHECCVYRARYDKGTYQDREPILGGMESGGDLCISPDESFLVIACWNLPENNGASDLYVSFRMFDGAWSPLQNLGAPVNNELNENCPMVSPDGRRFFFFRYNPETEESHSYWVDAAVIESLRPAG